MPANTEITIPKTKHVFLFDEKKIKHSTPKVRLKEINAYIIRARCVKASEEPFDC